MEIKQRIDDNNAELMSMIPVTFELNKRRHQLLKENAELQKECNHVFEDGYCIYCYLEENE